jgi:hypothetical protein
MRHPLAHLKGKGIEALRDAGMVVEVLGEDVSLPVEVSLSGSMCCGCMRKDKFVTTGHKC